jgi:hypothetical protein
MATVAGGYKINAAIAGGTSIISGSATIYTAPANAFAIVQISVIVNAGISGASYNIVSGGGYVVNPVSVSAGGSSTQMIMGIYVGPSQSVVANLSNFGAGSNAINITGVEFKNI